MIPVPIFEAKNKLPYFIHIVESGDVIQLTRHGKPVARILPESDFSKKDDSMKFYNELMNWRKENSDCFFTEVELQQTQNFRKRDYLKIRDERCF